MRQKYDINRTEVNCEDCYMENICSIKPRKECEYFKRKIPFYKWGIVWSVEEKDLS